MWLLTKDGVLIPERLVARINHGPDGSAIATIVDPQGRGSSAVLMLSFEQLARALAETVPIPTPATAVEADRPPQTSTKTTR
jgi:hypothetical protein